MNVIDKGFHLKHYGAQGKPPTKHLPKGLQIRRIHISPYETTLNKFEKCDDNVTRLSQGGPIEARVLAAS